MSKKSDKKFKTFRDLHRGDSSDDSDDEKNLFTGGERSGLEVEKPPEDRARGLVQDLLNQAARRGGPGDRRDEEGSGASSRRSFVGGGYRLGTEDAPSQRIGQEPSNVPEKVTKTCTFWKDGFSIDDGPLYRFDDPENSKYITQMTQGVAPLGLFNVLPGQSVDINVKTKTDQNYRPPRQAAAKFSGQGQRLGSPVPGEVIGSEPTTDAGNGKEKVSPEPTASSKDPNSVGENQTIVQVRLADGRKFKAIVDKSGPVQQIFDFVDPLLNDSREYFLSLPYPVKPITDKGISIQDAKLAQSVVIQRWT